MKKQFVSFLAFVFLVSLGTTNAQEKPKHKFVGVKACGMCHKAKTGNQLKKWNDSKHSKAFKTLQTAEADKIAKEKGFKTKAAETPECLTCHVTAYNVDKKFLDKKFKMEDGVQCETCHGPGKDYKSMSTMKNLKKAISKGLHSYKTADGKLDEAAAEKMCVKCHNKKSPTYKEFNFKKMWKEIEHPVAKK